MAAAHVVSLSMIMAFFKDQEKQFEGGENAYTSGHVIEFSFNGEVHPALVKGKVEASMKRKKCNVEVNTSSYVHLWILHLIYR